MTNLTNLRLSQHPIPWKLPWNFDRFQLGNFLEVTFEAFSTDCFLLCAEVATVQHKSSIGFSFHCCLCILAPQWWMIECGRRQLQPSQWNTILTPRVQSQYHPNAAGTVGLYLTPVKEQNLAIAIDKQNNLWFTVFLFILECLEYWYLQTSDCLIFLLELINLHKAGRQQPTDGPRHVLYQL